MGTDTTETELRRDLDRMWEELNALARQEPAASAPQRQALALIGSGMSTISVALCLPAGKQRKEILDRGAADLRIGADWLTHGTWTEAVSHLAGRSQHAARLVARVTGDTARA